MNLRAPRARMLIGPEGLCRSRSNGHLGKQHSSVTLELRCQSALRAHVRLVGAGFKPAPTAQGNANGDFPTGAPCI